MSMELYFHARPDKPCSSSVIEEIFQIIRHHHLIKETDGEENRLTYVNPDTGVTFEIQFLTESASPDDEDRGILSSSPLWSLFIQLGRPPWYGWELGEMLSPILEVYPFIIRVNTTLNLPENYSGQMGPFDSIDEIKEIWGLLNRIVWLALAEAGQLYDQLVYIERERLYPVWEWYYRYRDYLNQIPSSRKLYHEVPKLSFHIPSQQVVIIGGLPLNRDCIVPDACDAVVLGFARRIFLLWRKWDVFGCCPLTMLPEEILASMFPADQDIPAKVYRRKRLEREFKKWALTACYSLDEMRAVDPTFVVDFEFTDEERRRAYNYIMRFLERGSEN